jgi:hypothetical protein
VLACVILLPLVAGPAVASSQETGEIYGKILDQSGRILPGASVTLTSAALLQPLTATTSRTGTYRFPQLPIGHYTVTFTLAGFKTLVRCGVKVEIGLNSMVNAVLEFSEVRETITSPAESPIVDLRSASQGAP